MYVSIGAFSQMIVRIVTEPSIHVPERILIGHEFDVAIIAIRIEHLDLLRGEGRRVFPDCFVIPVSESVLGIELKLIEFKRREVVDQLVERCLLGDLAATDVQHVASYGEIGLIVDSHAWKALATSLDDLTECCEPSKESGVGS